MRKRLLLLLGGAWHDFAGFAAAMRPVLESAGYYLEVTYCREDLLRLTGDHWDGVVLYTCFTPEKEEEATGLSPEQVAALTSWVRQGGGLLALHAATVIGSSGTAYRRLLGGEFLSHPSPFTFTVYPLSLSHPITAGISAFTIYDEFYLERYDPSVTLLMASVYEGILYPMAWSREEGGGRVAHLAPGHFPEVWVQGPYQQWILQALAWLLKGK